MFGGLFLGTLTPGFTSYVVNPTNSTVNLENDLKPVPVNSGSYKYATPDTGEYAEVPLDETGDYRYS